MMNEYLTSNEQTAYPFRDDAPGLSQPGVSADYGTPLLPADFLLSAVVTYYGGEQIYLRSIQDNGGGSYEIQIGTASDVLVVCTVGEEASRQVVGAENVVEGVIFRAVTGPSFASYLSGMPASLDFGTELPLATAAHDTKPNKLLSLGYDVVQFEDVVVLQEGYNTNLEYDETTNELTLNIAGGNGLGRYNPCEDPLPVSHVVSLSGKRPEGDDGGFVMGGDPCWRIVLTDAGLTLVNDCKPCCECEDYEAVAAMLQKLLDKLSETWTNLENLINEFNDDVEEIEDALEDLSEPRLYGSASVGGSAHNKGHVAVTATLHNPAVERVANLAIVPPPGYLVEDEFLTSQNQAGAVPQPVPANDTIVLVQLLVVEDGDNPPVGQQIAVASGGGKSIQITWEA